jgi:hypothetical protein
MSMHICKDVFGERWLRHWVAPFSRLENEIKVVDMGVKQLR